MAIWIAAGVGGLIVLIILICFCRWLVTFSDRSEGESEREGEGDRQTDRQKDR